MNLSLTTHVKNGLCTASVHGPMTLSAQLPRMARELAEVFVRGKVTGIVMDLSDISAIDSAGLGELVNIFRVAGDHKARLVLSGVDRRTREMLELTHLDELLECYETQADAAAAVARPA